MGITRWRRIKRTLGRWYLERYVGSEPRDTSIWYFDQARKVDRAGNYPQMAIFFRRMAHLKARYERLDRWARTPK